MKEALKLALEALRDYRRSDDDRVSVAMGILQEALAEQFCDNHCTWLDHHPECDKAEQPAQQEPVAWIRFDSSGRCRGLLSSDSEDLTESRKTIWQPLYTTPPQRTWVGLTNEEMSDLRNRCVADGAIRIVSDFEYIRSIEAKLKEKNT